MEYKNKVKELIPKCQLLFKKYEMINYQLTDVSDWIASPDC